MSANVLMVWGDIFKTTSDIEILMLSIYFQSEELIFKSISHGRRICNRKKITVCKLSKQTKQDSIMKDYKNLVFDIC